jgi:mRNA interferase RelE/StbE
VSHGVTPFRPDIPPHVADVTHSFHPDLKQLIKSAIRSIAANPECGEPLKRELDGLRTYRVRRFCIAYAVHQKTRIIRLMAIGHHRSVYEELTERLRRKTRA